MKKVIPGKIKTQLRLDGYYNVLNKYGTQHDSTEYYQWATGDGCGIGRPLCRKRAILDHH